MLFDPILSHIPPFMLMSTFDFRQLYQKEARTEMAFPLENSAIYHKIYISLNAIVIEYFLAIIIHKEEK